MVKQKLFFPVTAFDADQELRVSELACTRGARQVFSDVAFHLKAGQALAVYGDNGSGKTSLLRLLAGLLAPQAGDVSLAHGPLALQSHYLGHIDGLKANLTVSETLRFTARLFNGADTTFDLGDIGLAAYDEQRVGDLSAGQKRRLMLARLAIAPRQIWLLDEPLTALDKQGRALIDTLAQQHLAVGGMILAASHEALGFATQQLSLTQEAVR